MSVGPSYAAKYLAGVQARIAGVKPSLFNADELSDMRWTIATQLISGEY